MKTHTHTNKTKNNAKMKTREKSFLIWFSVLHFVVVTIIRFKRDFFRVYILLFYKLPIRQCRVSKSEAGKQDLDNEINFDENLFVYFVLSIASGSIPLREHSQSLIELNGHKSRTFWNLNFVQFSWVCFCCVKCS